MKSLQAKITKWTSRQSAHSQLHLVSWIRVTFCKHSIEAWQTAISGFPSYVACRSTSSWCYASFFHWTIWCFLKYILFIWQMIQSVNNLVVSVSRPENPTIDWWFLKLTINCGTQKSTFALNSWPQLILNRKSCTWFSCSQLRVYWLWFGRKFRWFRISAGYLAGRLVDGRLLK